MASQQFWAFTEEQVVKLTSWNGLTIDEPDLLEAVEQYVVVLFIWHYCESRFFELLRPSG